MKLFGKERQTLFGDGGRQPQITKKGPAIAVQRFSQIRAVRGLPAKSDFDSTVRKVYRQNFC
jgi:hypothetical protein